MGQCLCSKIKKIVPRTKKKKKKKGKQVTEYLLKNRKRKLLMVQHYIQQILIINNLITFFLSKIVSCFHLYIMQNTYETNKNNELNFAKFCMLSEKKN